MTSLELCCSFAHPLQATSPDKPCLLTAAGRCSREPTGTNPSPPHRRRFASTEQPPERLSFALAAAWEEPPAPPSRLSLRRRRKPSGRPRGEQNPSHE